MRPYISIGFSFTSIRLSFRPSFGPSFHLLFGHSVYFLLSLTSYFFKPYFLLVSPAPPFVRQSVLPTVHLSVHPSVRFFHLPSIRLVRINLPRLAFFLAFSSLQSSPGYFFFLSDVFFLSQF